MRANTVGVRSAAQRHTVALRARAVFSAAPVSRQWTSAAASRRRERPATESAALPRRADLGCPYEVLGLPPGTSDEAAIKRAYRRLAKKYHPDVLLNSSSQHAASQPPQQPSIAAEEPHGSQEHAPVQFLSIAEAYSFIMERLRNGVAADGVSPRPGNSRAFHEWMWEFRMRRTWQRQQRQAAAPPDLEHGSDAESEEPVAEDACGCSDSPAGGMGMNGGAASAGAHHAVPQSAEGLRSQLAGLRHRAAIRKNRPPTPSPSGASSSSEADDLQPMHPAFERGEGTWFAAAAGPSDSADPAPAAATAAAASHVASAEAEQDAEQPQQQPSPQPGQGSVEGHEAAAAAGGARRRFASNSTVREALREQLSGMRRKAALRERIYSGAEPGADGMAA